MGLLRCGVLRASLLAVFLYAVPDIRNTQAIQITRLYVPDVVDSGKAGPFELDCQFRCNATDAKLVVRWFFNDEIEPFYQWIAEMEDPVVVERFRERLEINRTQGDPEGCGLSSWQLRIVRPTVDMTGRYRCHVFSLDNEDSAEASMIVFEPPTTFHFNYTKWTPDKLTLQCEVTATFPVPTLKLYRVSATTGEQAELEDVQMSIEKRKRLFHVSLLSDVPERTLPQDEETVFECVLSYKDVTRMRSEKITYVPGMTKAAEKDPSDVSSQLSPFRWLIVSILILRFS